MRKLGGARAALAVCLMDNTSHYNLLMGLMDGENLDKCD
jgi:hypothetical protein